MPTLVSFHAHPDDEALLCGGTLAKAAAAGHRTVLVTATKGERGQVPDGLLRSGEALAARRSEELAAAAGILGVARLVFLDYLDSGMRNMPTNHARSSFWSADIDEAAQRLAAVLREENAEVLTIYDDHGVYGHPDHIQVHRVGIRAAELAGTPYVFEATFNRDRIARMRAGSALPPEPDVDGIDDTIGLPESEITTAVEVGEFIPQKRAAIAAHASQITEGSFFLEIPSAAFQQGFGTEWYRQRDIPAGGPRAHDLFG